MGGSHMGVAVRLAIASLVAGAILLVAYSTHGLHAQTAPPPAPAKNLKIVAFGDSLTAGYQLRPEEAFPVQLQAALKKRGRAVEILNGGVSGDTAGGGLARLDWAVPADAGGVILELGANDALRGIDPGQTRKALEEIIVRLKARGVQVLLAGMQAPRNLGEEYRTRFDGLFPELARVHGLLLYPFFMDGVVLDPKLTLDDRMHPTGAGVGVIVEKIMPDVLQLIARIETSQTR